MQKRSLPHGLAVTLALPHTGLIALALLIPLPLAAQVFGTDNHTVTVQVLPITDVQIVGGGVTLDFNNANVTAGQDLMTVTDQNTQLRWATNSSGRKITVNSNLTAPFFVLTLLAGNPTQGSAAPEVTLTNIPRDLLLNIGRSRGNCLLRYTATASASQGTGAENHIITFTVQAQ